MAKILGTILIEQASLIKYASTLGLAASQAMNIYFASYGAIPAAISSQLGEGVLCEV